MLVAAAVGVVWAIIDRKIDGENTVRRTEVGGLILRGNWGSDGLVDAWDECLERFEVC